VEKDKQNIKFLEPSKMKQKYMIKKKGKRKKKRKRGSSKEHSSPMFKVTHANSEDSEDIMGFPTNNAG